MFIGNVTAGQISTLVWTATSRTLTADPATDAGAATLVWGHSSRTLTADPATDAGAATLVWGHSSRTLTADPATDAGAAALVWGHSSRTLTADPATNAGAAALVWGRATGSEGSGTYGNLVVTNLDTNVGSRAPSSTALSTAQWTNTRASNLDNLDAAISSRDSPGINFGDTNFVSPVTSSSQNVYGAYVQVIASLAHTVRWLQVVLTAGTNGNYQLAFSTGAAGSEVDESGLMFTSQSTTVALSFMLPVDKSLHAKNTRLAVHVKNLSGASANTINVFVQCLEAND